MEFFVCVSAIFRIKFASLTSLVLFFFLLHLEKWYRSPCFGGADELLDCNVLIVCQDSLIEKT